MSLLAIDTTGPDCSVALRVAGRPDLCRSDAIGRGHAEHLAPMVAQMLADAGLQPSQIRRIGVTTGPGSFAGSRVGVAFVRGLALAIGAQAVGIGNLAAIARTCGATGPLAVLHDAKRGDLIVQVWSGDTVSAPERVTLEQAPARILQLAGTAGQLAGSGASLIDLAGFEDLRIETIALPALLDLVDAADAGQSPPSPFYARPPDAKLPGGLAP